MLDLLEEAKNAVRERGASYDTPENNFQKIGMFWELYLSLKYNRLHCITAEDVSVMMQLFKITREMYKHKDDNLVDLIGYVLCQQNCIEKKGEFKYEN